MMIRSNFAITRLLVLSYSASLLLYLLVVGSGGAWLYLLVRNGFEMNRGANREISSQYAAPLPADARPASTDLPAAQRLHSQSDALFLIRFDLNPDSTPLVQLDFRFDRAKIINTERLMHAIGYS